MQFLIKVFFKEECGHFEGINVCLLCVCDCHGPECSVSMLHKKALLYQFTH